MGIFLGAVLVFAALGVLIYPLLRRTQDSQPIDAESERLHTERARIYRLIGDLEADRRAGDLAVPEYRKQLRELRVAAARVMRAQARSGAGGFDDEALEREIEAARLSIHEPRGQEDSE